MFVSFNELPESSKIWIYQSDKLFTQQELDAISAYLVAFCQQWVAHNQPLRTSFTVLYNRFIVLAVDENQYGASGCSIDTSVSAMKSLGTRVKADLFNRNNIAFWINEEVCIIPLSELRSKLQEGIWNAETPVFNNAISHKGDLESNWRIPAGASWLKRYLVKSMV